MFKTFFANKPSFRKQITDLCTKWSCPPHWSALVQKYLESKDAQLGTDLWNSLDERFAKGNPKIIFLQRRNESELVKKVVLGMDSKLVEVALGSCSARLDWIVHLLSNVLIGTALLNVLKAKYGWLEVARELCKRHTRAACILQFVKAQPAKEAAKIYEQHNSSHDFVIEAIVSSPEKDEWFVKRLFVMDKTWQNNIFGNHRQIVLDGLARALGRTVTEQLPHVLILEVVSFLFRLPTLPERRSAKRRLFRQPLRNNKRHCV